VLAPKDRTLLLESLRPPPGFRLDAAVSTTYSLDLMALLVAPLAFTFFDWEGDDGQPTKDPNALLARTREVAAPLLYFCNPDNPMGSWHNGADIVRAADDNLYRAKRGGRNQVVG